MQSLIAEVFGHGDRGVDAGLARCHRHVRCVGDDDRALHQRTSGARVHELRELLEHARHLVAALATAQVDDHVCTAALGERFQQDGLAGAEAAGNRPLAAQGDRKQRIENALSGDEGFIRCQPTAHGSGRAYRPEVPQRQCMFVSGLAANAQDDRIVRNSAGRGDPFDGTRDVRRHESALRTTLQLSQCAEDRPGGQLRAYGNAGGEIEDLLRKRSQRAQQAVEDVAEQARSDLDAEQVAGTADFDTGSQSCRVLVDLRDDLVFVQPDDFAEKPCGTDSDRLAQHERPLGPGLQHGSADRMNARVRAACCDGHAGSVSTRPGALTGARQGDPGRMLRDISAAPVQGDEAGGLPAGYGPRPGLRVSRQGRCGR